MKVTVYGRSDDLVEVDGDLSEEFGGGEAGTTLVFGDGTHLLVKYADDGCWRIERTKTGTATCTKVFTATDSDSKEYSDRVELEGDLVSVDKVRSRGEIVDALDGARWREVRAASVEDALALYALAKKVGAI